MDGIRHGMGEVPDPSPISQESAGPGAKRAALPTNVDGDANSGRPEMMAEMLALVKASQTISSGLVLDELLHALIDVVLQTAMAQRACLLLSRNEELWLAAEARLEREKVKVQLHREPNPYSASLPRSIVDRVRQTREKVLVENVAEANPFSADEYLSRTRPKAVLCLPVVDQTEFLAVLYLENPLVTQSFPPAQVALLELLASQAAISLQHSFQYRDLQRENTEHKRLEEHYRSLVENLDHVVFRLDAQGIVTYINPVPVGLST
jgi:GAF domain-containing protein